jgi:hypothetical protein
MARTAAQDYLDVGRIATTAEDIYYPLQQRIYICKF